MSLQSDLVAKRNELGDLTKKVKKVREETKVGENDFDLMKSKDWPDTADQQARINDMRNWKTKMDALGADIDKIVEGLKAMELSDDGGNAQLGGMIHGEAGRGAQQAKSLGERFVNSQEFKSALANAGGKVRMDFSDIGLKTLMTTSAGFAPESVRDREVEMMAVEPVGLFNLIPKGQTGQAAVVYMEETTRTQAAAERVEGTGAYAESALAFTERSVTVQDIGHFIPVTRAQLDDVPMIRGIIDEEMRKGLLERLDYQLINGDGSSPNVLGFLNVSGIGQKDAIGQAPLDALYQAMVQVQKTGFAEPNIVFCNGEDWEPIQLMKTDNGQYIWGHPADIGPMRVWGRRLVPTFRIAKGSAGLGDFSRMKYFERTGITVEISDSHSDYFTYNKLAIRAWTRGAFVWRRPTAFCKVTNLAV